MASIQRRKPATMAAGREGGGEGTPVEVLGGGKPGHRVVEVDDRAGGGVTGAWPEARGFDYSGKSTHFI
jgi:hypothetical protein